METIHDHPAQLLLQMLSEVLEASKDIIISVSLTGRTYAICITKARVERGGSAGPGKNRSREVAALQDGVQTFLLTLRYGSNLSLARCRCRD